MSPTTTRSSVAPILAVDGGNSKVDVAIAELLENPEDPIVARAGPERAAEPRPRIDPGDLADRPLRVAYVRGDPIVGEERQASVIEAVVADEMAVIHDAPGGLGMRLDPAALEEPRGGHAALGEHVEDRLAHPRPVRAVGMLGVEGQGHPELGPGPRRRAYFSTPLITMPRVKNRWKIRKMITGMIIVISVPAWMNAWLR